MSTPSLLPPIAPLFVPGDRPERFAKAAASEADAVIIDLEDAVDAAAKPQARKNLLTHGLSGKPVLARINGADSPYWADDLAALKAARLDGVMVPKAETAEALAEVAAAAGPQVAIIPLIETAVGLANVDAVLRAPGVVCIGFGSLDFGLDLDCVPDWEPLLFTRSTLVLASRLANRAPPIDGVTPTLDDPALVEAEARRARALGFGGKLAIHPRQVGAIHAAFRPTEREVAWATRVAAAAKDGAALKVDGQMVDRPLVERALKVLRRSAG